MRKNRVVHSLRVCRLYSPRTSDVDPQVRNPSVLQWLRVNSRDSISSQNLRRDDEKRSDRNWVLGYECLSVRAWDVGDNSRSTGRRYGSALESKDPSHSDLLIPLRLCSRSSNAPTDTPRRIPSMCVFSAQNSGDRVYKYLPLVWYVEIVSKTGRY